jgi:SAM-dependent methyltransferase
MSKVPHKSLPSSHDDEQAMFNRQLATYRKIVGANLMYHREVYGVVGDVISRSMNRPFRFLDIACGDAHASARMLEDTAVVSYCGIDLSPESLELAAESLRVLKCPVRLICGNFVDALSNWGEPVDVIWIGMSLHHLCKGDKARFIADVHRALASDGMFLIWEPTLLDGESRDEWLDRFTRERPVWAAITDEEFAAMDAHVRLADFPESAAVWKAMGYRAGFAKAEELYMMSNRLGRIFSYLNRNAT